MRATEPQPPTRVLGKVNLMGDGASTEVEIERAACVSFRWDAEAPDCMVTFFDGEGAFEKACAFKDGVAGDFPDHQHVATCNKAGAEAKGARIMARLFGPLPEGFARQCEELDALKNGPGPGRFE